MSALKIKRMHHMTSSRHQREPKIFSCTQSRHGLSISSIIKSKIGVEIDKEYLEKYETGLTKTLEFNDPLNRNNTITFRDFTKNTYILEYYNNDNDDYNDETYILLFNYHDKERINKIKNNNFNLLSKTVVIPSNKISITEL